MKTIFVETILLTTGYALVLNMALNPSLTKSFPRDFKSIPLGTEYGTGTDEVLNKAVESRRLKYLEEDLFTVLKDAVTSKERPIFTTALIAGDAVILDALAKMNLLSKVPVVFVDTFTLFPESIQHLREVEEHYGFKSLVYHAADCKDQEDYYSKYGRDYWMKDIDKYDMLCKVYNTLYFIYLSMLNQVCFRLNP
jgi:phosphoadenosine phosphosulfate reductase